MKYRIPSHNNLYLYKYINWVYVKEEYMLNLKEKSLDWAIKSIIKNGDSYIFPNAFEFDAINENWVEVKEYLLNLDVLSNGLRDYRTAITPKSMLGFRISTQLDPLDSIINNAIIYEIHDLIENTRLPAFLNTIFSFRLKPHNDGTLYDSQYNWEAFNREAKRIIDLDEYNYIVVTDIADFYPSIYLHNIETHLRECVKTSGKIAHAESLINTIKAMHCNQTHKGLPIGPQFSRPIAELILNEIDQILNDKDIVFVRFVDDYRIFCKSESEAYKKLAFLAQKLYDMLNLKLNEPKTKIITKEVFTKKYLRIFNESEEDKFLKEFYELCSSAGIGTSIYDEIDFDSIDEETLEELRKVNLLNMLREELDHDTPDYGFIKILIGNLARFDNTEVAEFILKEENIRKLFPILKTIISYLHRVKSFSIEQKHKIGNTVLRLIKSSFISELEFNRSWLFSLFSKNDEWDNCNVFISMLGEFNDNLTKRELLLSIGRSRNLSYFRENKLLNVSTMDPWVARAFLAAISCLPKDERTAYYKSRSLRNRDFLEKIVEKWAAKNHF